MIRGIELEDEDLLENAGAQFGCEAEEEPECWYPTRDRAIRDARGKYKRR